MISVHKIGFQIEIIFKVKIVLNQNNLFSARDSLKDFLHPHLIVLQEGHGLTGIGER